VGKKKEGNHFDGGGRGTLFQDSIFVIRGGVAPQRFVGLDRHNALATNKGGGLERNQGNFLKAEGQ